MSKLTRISTIVLLSAGLAGSAAAHDGVIHKAKAEQSGLSTQAVETGSAIRDLWIGHIFWVRNVVLASFAGNADAATAAEEQVVANAKAIAGAIEPFYGADAKDALFTLLAGHYGAIKAYLDATIANDASGQTEATDALTKNAEEIAILLSGANPNLPKDDVNGLLLAHGGHHIQAIQDIKSADYAAEARTWEEMKAHMYVIADALTNAIAKQFAERF